MLLVLNLAAPIFQSTETGLYVSLWYFLAAFAWTGLVYFMGNYLPQFWVPGTAGAAITGLFIHDLVGLFVTPIGWGLMYFFVPLLLRKPIWSHALSLIGFWGIAFFYPMQGVHHFLLSPIPMYAQYGAIVATIAVEIVVVTVHRELLRHAARARRRHPRQPRDPLVLHRHAHVRHHLLPVRLPGDADVPEDHPLHATGWSAHAHMVMFGVFGFWIMGVFVELWPRVVGRPWVKPRLLTLHYWLTLAGLSLMVVDLTAAGLVQGFSWASLAHWGESVVASMPFWWVRTVAGLVIVGGARAALLGHVGDRAGAGGRAAPPPRRRREAHAWNASERASSSPASSRSCSASSCRG